MYIGDSLSDLAAANAARVHFVGYASKPDKVPAMREAGAPLITDHLKAIVTAIRPET